MSRGFTFINPMVLGASLVALLAVLAGYWLISPADDVLSEYSAAVALAAAALMLAAALAWQWQIVRSLAQSVRELRAQIAARDTNWVPALRRAVLPAPAPTGSAGPVPAAAGRLDLAATIPLDILVADDIELNRRVVLLMLKGLGYEARAVASGREAVEAVCAGQFDLVLMDLRMPDQDGIEATQRIIGRLGDRRPRITAVTTESSSGDRERCREAGLDDFIAKPITLDALRGALERAGEAARARRARLDTGTTPH